ncbi:hypothetical protein F8S13_21855 [Chloroflexia bacterium SDU3-3]|nr:hypothetical protein F8S13_21855 [Chloroflexia bacterium SDU3-3]
METTRRLRLNSTSLVLIPLAIVINIAIGQLAAGTPVYLDSIGTVLVGALMGPLMGALTGMLSNLIWGAATSSVPTASFFYVAGTIGLIAGFAGKQRLFLRASPRWFSAVVGAIFLFALTLFVLMFIGRTIDSEGNSVLPTMQDLFVSNWFIFVLALAAGAVAGYAVLQRGGYAGMIGLLTGVLCAIIAAPTAAYFFSGVTGGGTDMLVALYRASGANIMGSVLAQSTTSDPFDKMTSFMLVWLILQALPRRILARFPYGLPETADDQHVPAEPLASRLS